MRAMQRDLQSQLRTRSVAIRDRVAALIRPLTPAQLDANPDSAGWSVAQVLEHLCLAGERSEAIAKNVLRGATSDPEAGGRAWKPSFIGGLIASSLSKPRPLKAPRVFQPGPAPRPAVVDAWLAGEERFLADLDGAGDLDWRSIRFASPAMPAWAPKMNFGDGFNIHTVHTERHARQIERLVARLGGGVGVWR